MIKEPNGSHAAPFVMSLLPAARLIFLYRDGRDVIDSLLALNAPGGLLASWRGVAVETPEQRLALVREESLNGVARMTATEHAFEQRPPELRWRLRYEDLVADPERCLAAVEDWLRLERSRIRSPMRSRLIRWARRGRARPVRRAPAAPGNRAFGSTI